MSASELNLTDEQKESIRQTQHQFMETVEEVRKEELNAFKEKLTFDQDPSKLLEESSKIGVKAVMKVIDGSDKEDSLGYHLSPKEEDLALMPATTDVWNQHNESISFKEGHSISGNLVDYVDTLFDTVNS